MSPFKLLVFAIVILSDYALSEISEKYDLKEESYSVSELVSFNVPGGSFNGITILDVLDGYVYGIYKDADRRPHVFKFSLDNPNDFESSFVDKRDDYVRRDSSVGPYQMSTDGHHTLGLVVDGDGYIHLVLDMHNYPDNSNNFSYLPVDFDGSNILYWKSKKPHSIEEFEFLGKSGDKAPQGYGFTYQRLLRDRTGNVYMSSRNIIGKNQGVRACKGAALTMYSVDSKTWEMIGGYTELSETHPRPGFGWEYNGENGGQYTKQHPDFTFAPDNRMHYTFNLLKTNYPYQDYATEQGLGNIWHWMTHSMYVTSPDISTLRNGALFEKANGDQIILPARVEPGSRQGDIVYEAPGYESPAEADFEGYIVGIRSRVTFDQNNNPLIVSGMKQVSANANVPSFISHYENGTWNRYSTLGKDESLTSRGDYDLATDDNGVMTMWGYKYCDRMFHPRGTVVRHTFPHALDERYARTHFQETGDMIYIRKEDSLFIVEKIEFLHPPVENTSAIDNNKTLQDGKSALKVIGNTLSLTLNQTAEVTIHQYNLKGALIHKRSLGILNQGSHSFSLENEKLSKGVYIWKMIAGNRTLVSKTVLK